jgi:hypothetical protein
MANLRAIQQAEDAHVAAMQPRQGLLSGDEQDVLVNARRVRGALLSLLGLLLVTHLVLGVLMVRTAGQTRIYYQPAYQSASQRIAGRVPTDAEIEAVSLLLVTRAESYQAATVDAVRRSLDTHLDPGSVQLMDQYFATARSALRGSAMRRYVAVFAARIYQRNQQEFRIVAPYRYALIEEGGEGRVSARADRAALLTVVLGEQRPENPYGIYLLSYQHMERAAWVAAGRVDYWKDAGS